jgi:hypothetical protein
MELLFYKKEDVANDELAYKTLRRYSAKRNHTTLTAERIFRIDYRDGARNAQVGNLYVHHHDEALSEDLERRGFSYVIAIFHDKIRSDIFWIYTTSSEHATQMDDSVRITYADGTQSPEQGF